MGSAGTLILLGAVCGLAAGGPVHVVHVRQAATPIQCNTESRNMDGDTYTVTCPSGCASNGKTVWGTDVYTDDSSICRAAIHAGRISDSGGDVTVYKLPGEGSYSGTTQNGVQTAPYGAWGGSFAFSSGQPEEQAPAVDPGLEYIDCNTQSRQMDGDSFTVMCPADCASAGSNVWGSAIYTDDSSICRAAINDGRIPTNGGEVTVYKLPGQDSYQDSDQHGVATFPYGAWSGSFAFSQNPSDEAQESAAEPAAYPADCNTQSRNVDGESFTASCPAGCAAIGATVWGSAVYTDDSGLCRAAIHDGRITDAGGEVTVYKQPGQDAYAASDQNGILTVAYGTWGGSFAFTADIPQQAPAEPTPAPGPPMVDCNTEPRQLDGESTTVQCPDGCLESGSTVWGFVIYTDDSSLCRAAIHDGRIPAEGGEVTLYKLSGQESYLAAEQHGITTREYGSWSGSFAFSSDPVVPEVEERAAVVDCNTQSRDMDGDSYTVVCPAGCETGATVWGLVIYTDDSSICRAAIHDGRITNSGGEFTVYKIPGQDSYLSSEQNGVQTLTYSSWGGSFAFTPDPAVPQQNVPQEEPAQGSIDCSTEPRQLDGDVLTVTCPAGCLAGAETVWGTVIYTDDSSICRAAIHDGKITDSGGELTVYKLPGQDSYLGTQQNGIITAGYGTWGGSFAFTSEPVVPQEPIEEPVVPEAPSQDTVTCHTQSRDMDGDSFTANCPSGCTAIGGTVWGKAIYTDDSSICRAAIHDGRIPASGGEVEVFKHPGQESYEGSDQNDIQTLGYGSWGGSFAFTADIPQQAPPQPTPASGPPTVDCNTEPRQLDGDNVTVECPDGCLETGGVVWGFVIYTDDSSICRAAIHDGQIPAAGGEVTGYKLPGQESYQGSDQNGIQTLGYGSWGGSFAFTADPVIPPEEQSEPQEPGATPSADCNTESRQLDGDIVAVTCPDGCKQTGGSVWGTVVYTDDSSICRAAIHDGRIEETGGEVTIYKLPGRDAYLSSGKNGITTTAYGSWGGSFAFSENPVIPEEQPSEDTVTCSTEARDMQGESFTIDCPADCASTGSTIWGDGIYTDDSSICRAAIHAGMIGDSGGEVTVYMLGGQDSYEGSEANGVSSLHYGSWGGSFGFTSGNEEGGQEGEGSEGSEFTCSVSCENGGVCIAQDKCECPVGFTGDHCESESRAGPNDGRQGNTWTLSNMTCMCYFDYSRADCGCCVPGGCQCTNEHPNLCVQCGYGHLCGVLDDEVAIDGWTLSETGCACPWGEPGNTDCACCRNRGCLCDQAHPNRCTQCGRPYDCGLTGIGWP
ncbi:CRISPLD1 [Branchiostoma lanceolatum]|uniref:CRISPLD1 protein n=1 Tax=Branchiostoma lanceolatum TaxID=7740 RepID=A0A8J9WFF5_BRALA|nr:CRISPLD1 [Branchiostoma lanceolatum]